MIQVEPKPFSYDRAALQIILERDAGIHLPTLKMQKPWQTDKDVQM